MSGTGRLFGLLLIACLGTAVIHPSAQVGGGAVPARDQGARTGTSVIRGRVTDRTTGTPVRKAEVRLMGGGLREPRFVLTDDQGAYTFTTLAAGNYMVGVTKSGYVNGGFGQSTPSEPPRQVRVPDNRLVDSVDIPMMRGGVITGRILDESGEPLIDAQVWLLRYRFINGQRRLRQSERPATTNDIGEFRLYGLAPGEIVLAASSRGFMSSMGATMSPDRIAYGTTYYPGTLDASQAQALTLGPGQQLSNVMMSLTPGRTVRVTGSVLNAQGDTLTQGVVTVMNRDTAIPGGMAGQIRPDGTFTVMNLTPGNYRLTSMTQSFPLPNGRPPAAAYADLTVGTDDISGVQLTIPQPVTVSGRIIVDPAAAASLRLNTVRPFLNPIEDIAAPRPFTPSESVRDDLTFSAQTYPGLVSLRLTLPAGWMVRSVTLNGQDAYESFAVGYADLTGLEVEISNRAPDVSFSVVDGNNQAVPGAFVIVFPQDPTLSARPVGGRSIATRADEEGKLRVRTLMPGSYYVATTSSLPDVGPNPEFFESLVVQAERLELAEGDAKTLALRAR